MTKLLPDFLKTGGTKRALRRSVSGNAAPPPTHEKPLKAAADQPMCPLCNSHLRRKTRRSDNKPFWGCSRFPDCCCTLEVADFEQQWQRIRQGRKLYEARAKRIRKRWLEKHLLNG